MAVMAFVVRRWMACKVVDTSVVNISVVNINAAKRSRRAIVVR